jgi:hypothetical protein
MAGNDISTPSIQEIIEKTSVKWAKYNYLQDNFTKVLMESRDLQDEDVTLFSVSFHIHNSWAL